MALRIEHSVPVSTLTTFRIGGTASEVVTISSEDDLSTLFSLIKPDRKWFVLGGGSNVIFPDGEIRALLIRMDIQGISSAPTDSGIILTVGAGVSWDAFVEHSVSLGLTGVEALSAIPGTVGATPIQNVGAYGSEVKDTIVSVRAFDTQTKSFVQFTNEECLFSYRDSIFKHVPQRYIITTVSYRLKKEKPVIPNYPGVSDYFENRGISNPDVADIRSAIVAIRATKLPDPSKIASVGSFFKNPIISKEQADTFKEKYPSIVVFPISAELSKVGAGSLIDTLGWKGKSFGAISIYSQNALVLVNEGGATRTELEKVVESIVFAVKQQYGIVLTPEPEMIDTEAVS